MVRLEPRASSIKPQRFQQAQAKMVNEEDLGKHSSQKKRYYESMFEKMNDQSAAERERDAFVSSAMDLLNKQSINSQVKDLFVYYAQYGERLNISTLKAHKFHKLLADAGLEENFSGRFSTPKIPRERTDIIYK